MVSKVRNKTDSVRQLCAVAMFVDIEGFSRLAHQKAAELFFDEVRQCLERIASTVNAYGGKVSQVIGGGLLCYFESKDLRTETDPQASETVNLALKCAAQIQLDSVDALLALGNDISSSEKSRIFLPLRIGVSFGDCFIGNLLAGQESLVGEPVQLAKRLESASEIFKILVTPTVRNILDRAHADFTLGHNASWGRRFLQVKNQSSMFEAWECNPFGQDSESLKAAQRVLRSGNKRSTRRMPWLCEVSLSAIEKQGAVGRIVDYSELGFCIEFEQAFARAEILDLTVTTGRADWNKILAMKQLEKVSCEIRWIEAVGELHWHGVSFVGTPVEQSRALSELLIQLSNNADHPI
jgi:class 3 adenylate cyclase